MGIYEVRMIVSEIEVNELYHKLKVIERLFGPGFKRMWVKIGDDLKSVPDWKNPLDE